MKSKNLFQSCLIFLFLSSTLQAQNVFSPGYLIASDGTKKEGFIKNKGWKNNPNAISFKESLDGQSKRYELKDLTEFGIQDVCKYIKAKVPVSKSQDMGGNLDDRMTPRYDTLTILLKVILEGDVDLYGYRVDSKQNFYFKEDGPIQTLVYKKFQTENKLKENLQYQQQIKNDLNFEIQNSDKIEYREKSLKQLFINNFETKGINYQSPLLIKKESNNALKFQIGADLGMMNLENVAFMIGTGEFFPAQVRAFESTANLRFGLEFIHTFPYNNRKWEMMVGANYQSYKSESIEPNDASINYSSTEWLVGLKYRSFINPSLSFDLASYFLWDIPIVDEISVGSRNFELNPSANFELSAGFTFKNLYSLEIRSGTNRNLLNAVNTTWSTKFRNVSLLFGYRLGVGRK